MGSKVFNSNNFDTFFNIFAGLLELILCTDQLKSAGKHEKYELTIVTL